MEIPFGRGDVPLYICVHLFITPKIKTNLLIKNQKLDSNQIDVDVDVDGVHTRYVNMIHIQTFISMRSDVPLSYIYTRCILQYNICVYVCVPWYTYIHTYVIYQLPANTSFNYNC